MHRREADCTLPNIFLSWQCRKDVAHEPVCQQEVQQPVQGDNWSGLPDQGGDGRRQARHHAGKTALIQWHARISSASDLDILHRRGTQLARNDSRAWVSLSTGVPTAAFLSLT
jgi:hypothetical protein